MNLYVKVTLVNRKIIGVIALLIIVAPMMFATSSLESSPPTSSSQFNTVKKLTIISLNETSFVDELAYLAAIPANIFWYNGELYVSPIISPHLTDSERLFLSDWKAFCDLYGGISQVVAIGNISLEDQGRVQTLIDKKVFPIISGSDIFKLAAKIAEFEWKNSEEVVIAVIGNELDNLGEVIESTDVLQFIGVTTNQTTFTNTTESLSWSNYTIEFDDNVGVAEIEITWPGDSNLTHSVQDPTGFYVDNTTLFTSLYLKYYHDYNLVSFLPNTISGIWRLNIFNATENGVEENFTVSIIKSPGVRRTLTVPEGADWLNVSIQWDNRYEDLDLFLINPYGKLVDWSVDTNVLSTEESVSIPYPQPGNWTILVSWWHGNGDLSFTQKSRIHRINPNVSLYIESAANGAIIASAKNIPLLYSSYENVSEATIDVLNKLNVKNIILVDIANASTPEMLQQLENISNITMYVSSLADVFNFTHYFLNSSYAVLTFTGSFSEGYFAPATALAAYHKAPVVLLDNSNASNLAQGAWAPLKLKIASEPVGLSEHIQYWEGSYFEERAPKFYDMKNIAEDFSNFICVNGGFGNETISVVSPEKFLEYTFDRAIIGKFTVGRFSSEYCNLDVSVFRSILYPSLITLNADANNALLTYYAYSYGLDIEDKNGEVQYLYDVSNTSSLLSNFSLIYHVGVEEVRNSLNSGVTLWIASTHGVLDITEKRDNAQLLLRSEDVPWWFEPSGSLSSPDSNGDKIVDPDTWENEAKNYFYASVSWFEENLDNLHSATVFLISCLVGSTLSEVLINKGAVAVLSSFRTVYLKPASLFEFNVINEIVQGKTLGLALKNALLNTSIIYSLNSSGPAIFGDFSLQYLLFGDPELNILNSTSTVLDTQNIHIPSRLIHILNRVGVFGNYGYVIDELEYLNTYLNYSIFYEFFNSSSNQTNSFMDSILEFTTVILETGLSKADYDSLKMFRENIVDYIRHGGTLIILNACNCDAELVPYSVLINDKITGSTFNFSSSFHPLKNTPNNLTGMRFNGVFEDFAAEYFTVAFANSNAVWLAANFGYGKYALATFAPDFENKTEYIENIISWYKTVPIKIEIEFSLTIPIIYTGEHIQIMIYVHDIFGWPVDNLTLRVYLGNTPLSLEKVNRGVYAANILPVSTQRKLEIKIEAWGENLDPFASYVDVDVVVVDKPWALVIVGTITLSGICVYSVVKLKAKLTSKLKEM